MILPDVNLLIYAYNSVDPRYERARSWWEAAVEGPVPVGLAWPAISGFIRLMTHPRVLTTPMNVDDATRRVRTWLDHPNITVLQPGKRFASLFLHALNALGAAGNMTTDAYLASLAIEHQAELHSNDADFSRFPGLRWSNPLQ
jgi:toxin-antitoxin system PIN domain toxin